MRPCHPIFVQKLRQHQTKWDICRYGPPPAPRAIFRLRMPRAAFDNFQRKAQSVSLSAVNWTWRDDRAAVVPLSGSISSSGIQPTWDLLRYRSCPSVEPRGIAGEPSAAIPRHYHEMCSFLQRHAAVSIRCHPVFVWDTPTVPAWLSMFRWTPLCQPYLVEARTSDP